MTTGALIFAFNNEKTDYLALAAWSAKRIRQYLDIPVAVVTDADAGKHAGSFDKIILANPASGGSRYFDDYKTSVTWNNANRIDAYSLTPWDRTLLLDADYVVDSRNLRTILHADRDFMCFRNAFDMASPVDNGELLPTFGKYHFPMWWATVIMFRPSTTAQYIFDSMAMIRENWQHYRNLYGIDKPTYRNDFALSIALGIVSGHTLQVDAIPWSMPSVLPDDELNLQDDQWTVSWLDQNNRKKNMMFSGLDFHAMGKRHLEAAIAHHA